MRSVIVLGGNSQLAKCIKKIENQFPELSIQFLSSNEGDIVDLEAMKVVFENYSPQVVINCAAYTAVDLAEDEMEKAALINTQGAGIIAKLCKIYNSQLIHISTDFVFDGSIAHPLDENDKTNPLSVYGKTKLDGEKAVMRNVEQYIILRTSWLYSEFGNNFVKTMLRLGKERGSLGVVADQIGSPTYAVDLAEAILKIARLDLPQFGIYHYSNEGVASWFDFAHAIFKLSKMKVELSPISTEQFPTKATRPPFSVMNKSKIKDVYSFKIPHWQDSLDKCIQDINQA